MVVEEGGSRGGARWRLVVQKHGEELIKEAIFLENCFGYTNFDFKLMYWNQ